MIEVGPADLPAELEVVRGLFRAYARSIGIDLGFQGFEEELAALPGAYAEPRGALLLARERGRAIGSVALRPLEGSIAEMKRLYVEPAARGSGAGRLLAEAVIARATAAGYTAMRLDTLASMVAAIALYRSLGFVAIGPYCFNPVASAVYLELDLRRGAETTTGTKGRDRT